jgi:type IX secretion system PorP/SprF family membrane protein
MTSLLKQLKIVLPLLPIGFALGQDFRFSQYEKTPILVNPAQSSNISNLRIISNYRNQWISLGSNFETSAFSIEKSIFQKSGNRVAMGGQFIYDNAGKGAITNTEGLTSLSATIPTGKSKISAGISFGIGQRSFNTTSLTWDTNFDGFGYNPNIPNGENANIVGSFNFLYTEASVGALWNFSIRNNEYDSDSNYQSTLGISARHVNRPKIASHPFTPNQLEPKINFHGNTNLSTPIQNLILKPNLLIGFQGKSKEINAGMLFEYLLSDKSHYSNFIKGSSVSLGINYRYNDAIITSIHAQYHLYSIGLSYDFNVSDLSGVTKFRDGFEISLRYQTQRKNRESFLSRISK